MAGKKLDGGTSREERVRRPTPSASACNRRVQTSAIENWIMVQLQPMNKRNLVLGWLSYSDLLPSSFRIFPFPRFLGKNDHPSDAGSVRDFATTRCLSGYLARFNARRKKVYKSRRFAVWYETDREIRWLHVTGLANNLYFFLCFLNPYLSVNNI